MPRGQEHDPIYLHQYLRMLCWSIFFQVFLENDCYGKKVIVLCLDAIMIAFLSKKRS